MPVLKWSRIKLIAGALILGGIGYGVVRYMILMSSTRGFRNNNPGNLRQTHINWLGEEGPDAIDDDPAFEEFTSMEFGIRAIGRLLETYYNRHRLRTIRAMISRYAPPNENDTESYVRGVAQRTGFGSDDVLPWPHAKVHLVEAIIHHENGLQPFSLAYIENSINLTEEALA